MFRKNGEEGEGEIFEIFIGCCVFCDLMTKIIEKFEIYLKMYLHGQDFTHLKQECIWDFSP